MDRELEETEKREREIMRKNRFGKGFSREGDDGLAAEPWAEALLGLWGEGDGKQWVGPHAEDLAAWVGEMQDHGSGAGKFGNDRCDQL